MRQGLLRKRAALSAGQSLLLRAALVLLLFGIAVAGHWFEREGLKDNLDNHISFLDVLYFTMITVATVGYGDIVPVSDAARAFDTFVVTPIRIFVFIIFFGTAYDVLIKGGWEQWRSRERRKTLDQHHIIAGFGRSGGFAARELLARGIAPEAIVVIDPSPGRVEAALDKGHLAIEGDATRNSVLERAAIARAKAIVITIGRDETTALAVLTARQLGPQATITASVLDPDNEELVMKAGADVVFNPARLAGRLLATAVDGRHGAELVRDLVSAEGGVLVRERAARPEEVGQPLSRCGPALPVRLLRGGQVVDHWDPRAGAVAAGDIIVEVARAPEAAAAR
jgi:voltage-gated potassium channel